jgi:hypothetical protein
MGLKPIAILIPGEPLEELRIFVEKPLERHW